LNDTSLSESYEDEPFDLEREPLDRPSGFDHDWGGDGSDLSRPVRTHVLAALPPNTAPYPPPVDALLALGDPQVDGVTERRQALGLAQEHVPDLLRMARDRGLYTAPGDSVEVWAPLHAFHALSDLDISAAVSELIPLFDLEDDYLDTALPELLGKVGAPAFEPVRVYLADRTRWAFGHANASHAMQEIAEQHPELREQVVEALSDVLREGEHYHEVAVTGAMGALVDLDATEALPLIRQAFELGQIDEMVYGPWGDVLDMLGVDTEEDDSLVDISRRRFEERHKQLFPHKPRESLRAFEAETSSTLQPLPPVSQRTGEQRARKQKNKRKMESASRKANRRKRK
jgi:hypothetical protein